MITSYFQISEFLRPDGQILGCSRHADLEIYLNFLYPYDLSIFIDLY
jgi:hypothetical protein